MTIYINSKRKKIAKTIFKKSTEDVTVYSNGTYTFPEGVESITTQVVYDGKGYPAVVESAYLYGGAGLSTYTQNTSTVYALDPAIKDIGDYALVYLFSGMNLPHEIVFTNVETISGSHALEHFAYGATSTPAVACFKFPKLTKITGDYAFYAFSEQAHQPVCTFEFPELEILEGTTTFYRLIHASSYGLVSQFPVDINFPKLKIIQNSSYNFGFYFIPVLPWQESVTVNFPALTTIKNSYTVFDALVSGSSIAFASINFSKLKTIESSRYIFQRAFEKGIVPSMVSFPELTSIEGRGNFMEVFKGAKQLQVVQFPELKSITADSSYYEGNFEGAFYNTPLTTVDFSNLEYINDLGCFQYAFGNTSIETLSFPKLHTVIGARVFSYLFSYWTLSAATNTSVIKHIYFPTLQNCTNDVFNNMLQHITGCTVHFPSNMQSTMSNWQNVLNGFSGTNTSILFDL